MVLPILSKSNSQHVTILTKPANGSTLALAILAASRVNPRQHHPQVFYVASSYNAALQAQELMKKLGYYAGIKVGIVTFKNQGRHNFKQGLKFVVEKIY